jgi:hypothetical protein
LIKRNHSLFKSMRWLSYKLLDSLSRVSSDKVGNASWGHFGRNGISSYLFLKKTVSLVFDTRYGWMASAARPF